MLWTEVVRDALYSAPVEGPEGDSIIGPFVAGAILSFCLTRNSIDFKKSTIQTTVVYFGIFLLADFIQNMAASYDYVDVQSLVVGVKLGISFRGVKSFVDSTFQNKGGETTKKRRKRKRRTIKS